MSRRHHQSLRYNEQRVGRLATISATVASEKDEGKQLEKGKFVNRLKVVEEQNPEKKSNQDLTKTDDLF